LQKRDFYTRKVLFKIKLKLKEVNGNDNNSSRAAAKTMKK
jgi:hypothetical protein